jgi:hypothetical protein
MARFIKTLDGLINLERVSNKVSEKYVPIYTTDIIESLEPEFKFSHAYKLNNGTAHAAILVTFRFNEDGDNILIENSYDRTRAFRLSFLKNSFIIPLDLDKVVHIGDRAKDIETHFAENKENILEALKNAKEIVHYLQVTKIPKKIKNDIKNIVFENQIKSGKEIDITIASSYDSIFTYTETLIDRFVNGEYHTIKDGKVRKGRKVKSNFRKLQLTNKIYKYLKETYKHIFI